MTKYLLITIILFSNSAFSQVFINEVLSSNKTGIIDEDGDYPDWIEIYNAGENAVNLKDFFLSDDDNTPAKWQFPEIYVNPGAYLIVFASGKDRKNPQTELHTNFSISKDGEPILLSNKNGFLIDRLPPVITESDYSYGRYPDGTENIVIFEFQSPGQSNSGNNIPPLRSEIRFSHSPGYYNHDFLLKLLGDSNVEIRYTTNSTKPSPSTKLYANKAIEIGSLADKPDQFTIIPSSTPSRWREPAENSDKMTIVRARPFVNGIPVGEEICGSFWIGHHNPENNKLPVVSLVTCPENLFDYEEGIYVPGIFYDETGEENFMQRGREWERDVFFSFFDTLGIEQISQHAGMRIQGGWTRKYRQKSLRLYARNSYGNEYFEHPFFEHRENSSFKRLQLTSTMKDDYTKTLLKDELATVLVRNLDQDYLEFTPVIVFINGEYWGIHFLKERRDRYWLADNHDVDPENIEWLAWHMFIKQGSDHHYGEVIGFIESANPESKDTYDYIKQKMDVENYIDYMCLEIYLHNRDCPHNNIEYWRPATIDGKWRWIYFDFDRAIEKWQEDNLSHYFNNNDDFIKFFFLRNLMKIPEFKRGFISRMYFHMQNTVRPDIIYNEIEKLKTELEPHVPNHIARWQFPTSLYEWYENLGLLQNFAMLRPAEILKIMNDLQLDPHSVYPIPANNFFFIDGVSNLKPQQIQIYDNSGKRCQTVIINEADNRLRINTAEFKSGMHLISIHEEGLVFTYKLLIMH
jgi:hypothetical protein